MKNTPDHADSLPVTVAADDPQSDYDSPWKEAIGAYFQPFMQLFFGAVHDAIDWGQPHEFLDAELHKITGDSEIGKRYADRLVRVSSLEGRDIWLLIHIEVQGKADAHFNRRMFQYYYRIHDRYAQAEIISLAVVTNQRDRGALGLYEAGRDGFGVQFRFRVHPLQAWRQKMEVLKAQVASNPFAVVSLAQLAAHRKSSDPERKASKREIIWLMYKYRYGREDVLALLRFIDWMIRLPRHLDEELQTELIELEENTNMPYVMSFERFAEERGEKRGEKRGEERGEKRGEERGEERGEKRGEKRGEANALLRLIQAKFGPPAPDVHARLQSADSEQLNRWLDRILTANSPDELFG